MSGAAASSLPDMLGRLKLTAMRDRLDVLPDEAARRELNLPEALGLLCEAVPPAVAETPGCSLRGESRG